MGTPKSVGLVWDLPEESEVQVGCVADFVSGTGSKQAIIRVTCSDRSGLLAGATARAASCPYGAKGRWCIGLTSDRRGFARRFAPDLTGHLMYNRFDIMSANVTTDTESGAVIRHRPLQRPAVHCFAQYRCMFHYRERPDGDTRLIYIRPTTFSSPGLIVDTFHVRLPGRKIEASMRICSQWRRCPGISPGAGA